MVVGVPSSAEIWKVLPTGCADGVAGPYERKKEEMLPLMAVMEATDRIECQLYGAAKTGGGEHVSVTSSVTPYF